MGKVYEIVDFFTRNSFGIRTLRTLQDFLILTSTMLVYSDSDDTQFFDLLSRKKKVQGYVNEILITHKY